jgi:hypothetical protein
MGCVPHEVRRNAHCGASSHSRDGQAERKPDAPEIANARNAGASDVAIEFRTQLNTNYAHAMCRGEFAYDSFIDNLERAFEFAANESRSAVLFDIRAVTGEPPSVGERYDVGVRVAELQKGIGKGVLIAVVGHEPVVDPERLAEVVAKSHGAFIAVFTDIDEAISWIEHEVAEMRATTNTVLWPIGPS